MSLERFGRIGDSEVLELTIRSEAGAEARILTYGALIRDLVVPSPRGPQRVVLGLETIEDYVAHSPYFGATVGRYANRIGGARFALDGAEHRLVPNEGANQLHGGPGGFSSRLWTPIAQRRASVTLALVSADGDMGYPGRVTALCSYSWAEPASLCVALEAIVDAPTPLNLTNHSYFNLDGSATIDTHRLQIEADLFTPVDGDKIPTGEIATVADTPLDFRRMRPIHRGVREPPLYDHNFVLRGGPAELARAATLASPASGIALELWTSEPGLQFYDGHLLDIPVAGLGGLRYGPRGGLCLEPQRFPDGPNRPHFPPCILAPGIVSRQISEYRFVDFEGGSEPAGFRRSAL